MSERKDRVKADDQSVLSKDERGVSRRAYLAAAGGVVAVAVIGGAAYYLSTQVPPPTPTPTPTTTPTPTGPTPTPTPKPTPTPAAKPTLRYLGYPFYLPPEAEAKWEEETGVPLEVTYEDFIVLSQKQLADPYAWDVGASGRYRPLVKEGLFLEVPVEQMPKWNPNEVMEVFNEPSKYFSPAQAERFSYLLWKEIGKTLWSVPIMWNYDSLTYLPEFLPYEEKGSKTTITKAEIWNEEWKGKTAMMDEAFAEFSMVANYLDWAGQMAVSGAIDSLTPDEVDVVFNFLLPIVKSGQIKSFWFKYGDIVTLLSTKEVYISLTYQPACFDARKAGTPAYYACLQEGPVFWYNSNFISKYTTPEKVSWAIKFLDWQLGLWIQMLYTKQGYPSPRIYSEDYKKAMGDEFYDWFYMDKATYLPIDEVMKEIWPDRTEFWTFPERLQNALFLPDVYFRHFWTGESPRTGSPHPRGNRRDIGSVKFKQEICRYFTSPDYPDHSEYYNTKWEELKASLPV